MSPPSDPPEERSRPSSVPPSPSAYVLLEAELAAGGEAERVVWVSRQRPAPRGAVTLVVERDPAVRARVVAALRQEPDADRVQVGRPAFDVEGAVGVPEALERLLRGGVAVVLCGDVGPEEDARALHEALRRAPAFEAAPAVYFSTAPDAAMAAALGGPDAAERLCAAVAVLVERSDLLTRDVTPREP